ncbi:MAG: hypothetical protein P857_342 [Candidatus Xenolissoclinum pacificiensis L6]|uniref:Uncharacterized protein n=1 Tax=Candidatus Xenolissoclinum pacificiensis L6 TaxID=1401685 RepID=W2V190_9RICK|nr:MAG: hypothetical protein P857_342 [Candidatus Xenolissoclinum pacificiensis L6]
MKDREDKSDFSNCKAKCLFSFISAKKISILDGNLSICLLYIMGLIRFFLPGGVLYSSDRFFLSITFILYYISALNIFCQFTGKIYICFHLLENFLSL